MKILETEPCAGYCWRIRAARLDVNRAPEQLPDLFTFLGQVDPFPSQELQRWPQFPRNERGEPRGIDANPVDPGPVRAVKEGVPN